MGKAKPTQRRRYNNEQWDMDITLVDPGNQLLKYKFPSNLILELVIEESLLDWPIKGYLVYENPWETMERAEDYRYRMDARDELQIELRNNGKYGGANIPEALWQIKNDFIIYDTQDLPHSQMMTKCKKVFFWDKKYQLLLDNKREWSTATSSLNPNKRPNMSQMTDDERSLYTGDAVRGLLTDNGFASFITSNDRYWQQGTNKIFYSSPAEYSLHDSIKYVLKSQQTGGWKKPTACIFYNCREDDNRYRIRSLKSWFDEYPKEQYERAFVEDFYGGLAKPHASTKGITTGQHSTIYSYEFIDTAGINNTNALITKPVYWYDPGKGQFGTDFWRNAIEGLKDQKLGVPGSYDELYCLPKRPYFKFPIFTLNQTKKMQYNIDPKYTFSDASSNFYGRQIDRFPIGRNETLFQGVFLNEALHVRMKGVPFRTAGMWMAVEKVTHCQSNGNMFDGRLIGAWLVTGVQHIWKNDIYINDIVAVKHHTHVNLKINEDRVQ